MEAKEILKSPPPKVSIVEKKESAPAVETPPLHETPPLQVLSGEDSYIQQRMLSQPKTLEEVKARVVSREEGRHRLSLPDYFEKLSYDCAKYRGDYVFRWLSKNKRSLDHNLNVNHWLLVNRFFFPDAPKHLFSASGGVEEGDSILAFMGASQALEIRKSPSQTSHERVHSHLTKHERDDRFYQAKLSPEEERDEVVSGSLQEGRDF